MFEFYGLTRDQREKWLRLRFDFEPEESFGLLWRFDCEFESNFHIRKLGFLTLDELGRFIYSMSSQMKSGVGVAELNDAYGQIQFAVKLTSECGPVFSFGANAGVDFAPDSNELVACKASEISFERDVLNELYRYLNQIRHTYS